MKYADGLTNTGYSVMCPFYRLSAKKTHKITCVKNKICVYRL